MPPGVRQVAFTEAGKVVSSVCHGPEALTHVKLPSGKWLVEGKKVGSLRACFESPSFCATYWLRFYGDGFH